jgi:hypothetical protein
MGKVLFSLAFATALLACASAEASTFVCGAVGLRDRAWARSPNVAAAKLAALNRCARHGDICVPTYCMPR